MSDLGRRQTAVFVSARSKGPPSPSGTESSAAGESWWGLGGLDTRKQELWERGHADCDGHFLGPLALAGQAILGTGYPCKE